MCNLTKAFLYLDTLGDSVLLANV